MAPMLRTQHRLFVAFDIPPATRRLLSEIASDSPPEDARLVPGERLHATALFIGRIDPADQDRCLTALFDAMQGPQIPATLTAVCGKPTDNAARLVAVEYDDVVGLAAACVRRLEDAVAGRARSQVTSAPFWPHITLMRFRRPTDMRRFRRLESEHVFAFHRITLYDSYISSNGPQRYQALMTVPLDSHRERTHHHGKVAGA